MGTDSAIFRTLGTKTAMRTDQYNSRWLNGECPVQSPNDCWYSGKALAAFPQDFQSASNVLLVCKDPGDCICFWKPGDADLHQIVPPIIIFLLHLLPADPTFIHVHLIPDSAERNDDKLYFFFREKSSEMGQSPVTQSRIGRICLVCKRRQACLFWSENTIKRKLVLIWREKKQRGGFGGRLPAVFECLANADVLESTCALNLPVYNASLCLLGCPLTSDPVVFRPQHPGSPRNTQSL